MASGAGYTAVFDLVALTANTAKTVVSVVNGANGLVRAVEVGIGFSGTDGTRQQAIVELCKSTQATAGTSTPAAIAQSYGPTRTAQATAAKNFTVDPTVLTVIKRWRVPITSAQTIAFSLGREPEQVTSANALCLRVTSPDLGVNADGYIEFEEG